MGRWPPDDPRWCSLGVVIELRERQTGDLESAVRELERAMASGELRFRRQNGEEPGATFWKSHVIDARRPVSGLVVLIFRRGTWPWRWGFGPAVRIEGDFFVWKPDYDRLFSADRARIDHAPPPRVKRGRSRTKTGRRWWRDG